MSKVLERSPRYELSCHSTGIVVNASGKVRSYLFLEKRDYMNHKYKIFSYNLNLLDSYFHDYIIETSATF